MKRIAFLIGTVLLVQACTYAISSDIARQADKTIPFSRIDADPALYKGTLVVLGGTIAKTVNIDKSTFIEVEHKELDRWGRPFSRTSPTGRFLVLHTGFLDPLVYARGRELTAAVVVEGISREGVDDMTNLYPVVISKELKLWPREPAAWSRPSYMDPLLRDPYASPRD